MDNNSFLIRLGMNVEEVAAGVSKAGNLLGSFKESIIGIGKSFAAAFAVERIAEFTIEISKLAGEADGVKQAFSKLDNSTAVLDKMREATNGTVSNLDLMKSAVQANNFQIPIQQLGELFEFAHERAKATGQSVEYLTDSIVTGIGHKSPLILDNLGISASALKEKLHGAGVEASSIADISKAVGEIAAEAMAKSGKSMETVKDNYEQLGAMWENMKVQLGAFVNSGGPVTWVLGQVKELIQNISDQLQVWASDDISLFDKIFGSKEDYKRFRDELDYQAKRHEEDKSYAAYMAKWGGILLDTVTIHSTRIDTIKNLNERIAKLTEAQSMSSGVELTNINLQIDALQKKVKLLKGQGLETPTGPERFVEIGSATTQQEQIEKANQKLILSFGKLDEVTDEWTDNTVINYKFVHDAHERIQKDYKKMQADEALTQKLGQNLAQGLTQAFASIIDGSASFSQAIGKMVESFGEQMLAMALSAIIADAVSPSSSGGNYYVALALAGAGIAAIGALFSRAGVKHGGGGGGAAGGGPQRNIDRVGSGMLTYAPQQVEVNGQFKIEGADLVVAIKNSNRRASIVGG